MSADTASETGTDIGSMNSVVSVITVTFNCAGTLQETIDSVANQTYRNVEHIIVDGNSTDGTLEVIHRNQNIISRWISEPDRGIFDAMNKGLALMSPESDYISFLNAGDTFTDSNVLTDVVKAAMHTRGSLYGDFRKGARIVRSPEKVNLYMLSTGMICHQAIFFESKTHLKFPYDSSYQISSDYKTLLRMVRSGVRFSKIDRIVVDFDDRGVSNTDRIKLHEEKRRIRAEFPAVWFLHYFKTGVRKITQPLARSGPNQRKT